MLTFFTAPKPFLGPIAVSQRNALRSWARLPGCEILIFGDEVGNSAIADELGATHIPDVLCSPQGTPLVGDMFARARVRGRQPFLCFVNADIILTSDLLGAVRRVSRRRFLLVGQRWDLDLQESLTFDDDWEAALVARAHTDGVLHPRAGSDYFAYPRDIDWQMPPFVIGRVGWDNWTLKRARELSLDVIDASRVITAVHQNHEYTPAQRPPAGVRGAPEAVENLRLLDGRLTTLDHAGYVLTNRWLLPAIEPGRLRDRVMNGHFVGRLRHALRMVRPGWGNSS